MAKELKKIVLATSNKGKVRELADSLADKGYIVYGLDEFPQIGEIEENGDSFAENALVKARAVAAATGLPAIADDSGLMVDALGGAPGIYSARFGQDWEYLPGEDRDGRNIRKLLYALKDVPGQKRDAKFVTVMAVVLPTGEEATTSGEWHGRILEAPRGHNGFGYDPVFFDDELGRAAAELTKEEKNSRSHRGRALRAMLEKLPAFLK